MSRPASRTAPASVLPARAKRVCAAARHGDLYIFIAMKPHPFFQRDGADLFCRVPISMVQAAMGGEIDVRSVDGAKPR